MHVPGKINFGPDVLSRQEDVDQDQGPPASIGSVLDSCRGAPEEGEAQQCLVREQVVRQLAATVIPAPMSWATVRDVGLQDEVTQCLLR